MPDTADKPVTFPIRFDPADPVSAALRRARPRHVERLATQIGFAPRKIRSWRHGALALPADVVQAIADELKLDDQALDQHKDCRRRYEEHLAWQRERDAAQLAQDAG